ncbi:MAG: uracil-DNA glycosylase [Rubrivivax sp.]|nr:uracil-DNA glycosylase [Rubrivivax sp.]
MAWSERRRAMLEEMGLRVWQPALAVPAATVTAPRAADLQAPVAAAAAGAVVAPPRLAAESAPRVPAANAPQPVLQPVLQSVQPAQPSRPSQPALPAADVAALDWGALRAAVAGCRACALCEGRRQTVFGVGHPQAHWMIVGEAPGEQEDATGEPFVGPAGQLLDSMLAALGLARLAEGDPARRVFIANTLKCRPPGNRNPQPEEMQRCEPFLVRQIQLVRPRIVLAMGRFAVQALLRSSEPVGRLRGRVHRYEGVPLVVTYHPAYLLRNLPDKARAWEDLCLAADVVEREAAR